MNNCWLLIKHSPPLYKKWNHVLKELRQNVMILKNLKKYVRILQSSNAHIVNNRQHFQSFLNI